jgi:hypothetical protein
MEKHILAVAASALILAWGAAPASAQQSPGSPMMQPPAQQQMQQAPSQEAPGMMGPGGMMRHGMMRPGGMMGHGMMGRGMIGHASMMRIIFSLMDADGDGSVSLAEFQAAHERIFKGMDANKDGRLTLEEMQAFMHGPATPGPQQ